MPALHRFAAAALLALLIPATAAADTKAVYQSANGKDSLTFAVKGQMARWDAKEFSREQRYALYDAKRGLIILVDDGRKEIMELKPEAIRKQRAQMQSQLAPMMKQMQEQLKNMPPEQRRMIEKQMSGLMQAPGGEAKTTYTTKEIGTGRVMGIPCTRHSVLRDGQSMHEVCLASRTAAKVPAGDYQTIQKMFDTMREMASAVTSVSMPMAADLDGLPVEMKNNADGAVQTLKSLSTATLPADTFALPPYKVVTFGGFPGAK